MSSQSPDFNSGCEPPSVSPHNELCSRFEFQCNQGQRPAIETFLHDIPDSDRGDVLARLLPLEFQNRRRAGERIFLDEYCRRFPQYLPIVHRTWAAHFPGEATIIAPLDTDQLSNLQDGTVVAESISQPQTRQLHVPGQKIAEYQLQRIVGQGGMGVVYQAYHETLDIPVAIKFLHPNLIQQSGAETRFLHEARLAARLNHPGIVRVFDCGRFENQYFLVMEFVLGQNLKQWLDQSPPASMTWALESVEAVALALQEAFRTVGLIHRDVKPENLMLMTDGRIKLADLGLAKVFRGFPAQDELEKSASGMIVGTPRYMSPEQFTDSGAVDHRADMFSLGATLYHLLTGRVPFEGQSFWEIRHQVERAEPAPLPRDVPAEVDELLSRMLAKSPDDRFHSYDELIGAVQLAKQAVQDAMATPQIRFSASTDSHSIPSAQTRGRVVLPGAPSENRVLLIVDVQNDFCPNGALAVPNGDEVVPVINKLSHRFGHVIMTQDWHCADHLSFASAHPGKKPLDGIALSYGHQILWPDHCVQGTFGAEFHAGLDVANCELIIRKGFQRTIDSYSAFFENDRRTPTGLTGYRRERGLKQIFIVGLATDFCVAYSALDALTLGFQVTVIEEGCRGIDVDGSLEAAWVQMTDAGVVRA